MRLDNCEEKEYLSPMINGSLNTQQVNVMMLHEKKYKAVECEAVLK